MNGPSGTVIQQWYDSHVVCGNETCSVTPTTALADGAHTWKVQTWNLGGTGPWSATLSFTISPPGAATAVSPNATTTSSPTYTWNKLSSATYYYLWVDGPSGTVIKQWYTSAQANCDGASSTCSVTPTTALAGGSHTWWVLGWNPSGTGPWSSGMTFTVQSQGYAPKKVLAAPAVMDTVVATFVYDGDGRRVSQTIGGVTTYFVGNYYEKTGSTITKYYYAGTQRVAIRQGSTLYYLMSDHLGSTSLTVNTSGSIVAETRYKAWGETRYTSGTVPTKYTYTGQYSNVSDFGWMYYNARWYDPALGRMAQAGREPEATPAPNHKKISGG